MNFAIGILLLLGVVAGTDARLSRAFSGSFSGPMHLLNHQREREQASCQPGNTRASGKGFCAATEHLDTKCDVLEITEAPECSGFDGSWCCYGLTHSRSTSRLNSAATTPYYTAASSSMSSTNPQTTTVGMVTSGSSMSTAYTTAGGSVSASTGSTTPASVTATTGTTTRSSSATTASSGSSRSTAYSTNGLMVTTGQVVTTGQTGSTAYAAYTSSRSPPANRFHFRAGRPFPILSQRSEGRRIMRGMVGK